MRLWLAVLPALALGCASSSQPSLLGSRAPHDDQYCKVTWAPDPLPPVSAVVDSAELATALTRELGPVSGYALISLAADSAGTWTRARVIESTLALEAEEKLAAVVSQHLRSGDSRRQMRLRLDLDSGGRFELGATQSCRSALRNATEIERLLKTAAAGLIGRGVVVLHVHTNEKGQAGEILVSQSSGFTALDAAAVRIAARMAFYPALNDGIPVAVWSEVPLVFR